MYNCNKSRGGRERGRDGGGREGGREGRTERRGGQEMKEGKDRRGAKENSERKEKKGVGKIGRRYIEGPGREPDEERMLGRRVMLGIL